MEAALSVTMTHDGPSQEQLVGFFTMSDSTVWKAWDHSTGDHQSSPNCRFRFPVSGGHATGGDSLSVEAGEAGEHTFHVPRVLRNGERFKVLMQLFPDGRCGVAIDGRPLFLGAPSYLRRDARVILEGNSQETRNLVGPVQVHEGIAPIVWTRVP